MVTASESKAALRNRFRREIPPPDRTVSGSISERLTGMETLRSARTVALFCAAQPEPDLTAVAVEIESRGARLAWPRVTGEGQMEFRAAKASGPFVAGAFGLREPAPAAELVPLAEIDVLLVPGLAFDLAGYRLGRGKGFYDRVLGDAGFRGVSVGVAADAFVVDELPREAWDRPVHRLVTETRDLRIRKQQGD
ncbi:MAG: 5-formyltetrahydrofolate cyclo-ligase [Deltaproteobacteria bacterium]|nr:5-formyltetrahydrofolate cyclo-ligase [Deltaproteobacteria bacterium]